MLPLKLVATAEDASQHAEAASSGLLLCTNVPKELVMPWAWTGGIVAAYSSLASVASAEELKMLAWDLLGCQTATRLCPMPELSRIEFGSAASALVSSR
jgi:hypothetical protein